MQLSEMTVKLLKNFAQINNGIVIRKTPEDATQSVISTIDRDTQIFVHALVDDIFPTNVCLFDLSAFLNVIEGFESPEVEFSSDWLVIKDNGKATAKIVYADPAAVFHKDKILPKIDGAFSFELKQEHYTKVLQMGSLLGLPHLRLYSEDGDLFMQAEDKRNPNSNQYRTKVGEVSGDYNVYLKRENMKILPGDYTVHVKPDACAMFEHVVNKDLYYVVVLDTTK